MRDLEHFIDISRFAGERFDLTQAGGGNSSVKSEDGSMYIKASGFLLSEVSKEKGYAIVDNKKLLDIFQNRDLLNLTDKKQRETLSKELVDKTLHTSSVRPSIETLLHAILHKFVLHTHPVVVNAITCRSNWDEILLTLFPRCALVTYQTPGLELALDLEKVIGEYQKKYSAIPQVIFLQNHGLIISSDNVEDIYTLYDKVITTISTYLGVSLEKYKVSNTVSSLLNEGNNNPGIAYLSEDKVICDLLSQKKPLLFTPPFCPDTYVFCGMSVLELTSSEDRESIEKYIRKYGERPKVVLLNDALFFIAPNLKKAREMEDVFKFHVLTTELSGGNIQYLPESEIKYLGNWEAEKYRQKL